METTPENVSAWPKPLALDDGTYVTPPAQERLLHRLLLRSRLYYVLRFAGIVFGYWPKARKGRLDLPTWYAAAMDVFRIVENCGGRFTIKGFSHIQSTDGPVVFVANHMSTMETLILPAVIFPFKKPVYVIKDQLLKVPFFREYLNHCIAVTRQSPSEDFKQVMTRGSQKIARGLSVIIFPQATRKRIFEPEHFNSLGIKLARRNSVPVIPLALKTDFWGEGKLIKDFGPLDVRKTIHLEFGAPIHIHGPGKKEHEQVVSFISDRLGNWEKENHP